MSRDTAKLSWEEFAASLSDVVRAEPAELTQETRLIEDLGLDSLGLVELIVWLLADLEMSSLDDVGTRRWEGVTIGELYAELLDGRRVEMKVGSLGNYSSGTRGEVR